MSTNTEIIWRRGDSVMQEDVERVVKAARNELLLRSLQLPIDAIDTIRHNASKSNKTIDEYISSLILESIEVV